MASMDNYLAVDLGAESGRVMLGKLGADRLELVECYRFTTGPTEQDGSLRWDFPRLWDEVKAGLARGVKQADGPLRAVAVDSWGVDFGLLDGEGRLLENPYHYRDRRTDEMMEEAFRHVPRRDIYFYTGIQFMQINTIYQLLALRQSGATVLQRARHLLFMADLFAYYLSGEVFAEYTLASTSQLMDMRTGQWATALFEKLDLPLDIMPAVVPPGTVAGPVKPELAREMGTSAIDLIAAGSHDTASAVAAVPAKGEHWAYLSCGTWSLMGVETPQAIINDLAYEHQFTNEGGVNGTIRLLKNIMGLWLVQECRRQWQREGEELSYAELTRMAQQAEPFAAVVNPDDNAFLQPGDMPAAIREHLRRSGQKVIEEKGQLVRVILESLALRYRWAIDRLEQLIGRRIEVLHVVGGGIQNELLCQFTADALGRRVVTGPVEATASGNIIMQALATGRLSSLQEGRDLVARSFALREYQPRQVEAWQRQYEQLAW